MIRQTKPNTVVVELCDGRESMLHEKDKSKLKEIAEEIAGDTNGQGLDLMDTAKDAADVMLDWSNLISLMYKMLESLMGEVGGEFSTA